MIEKDVSKMAMPLINLRARQTLNINSKKEKYVCEASKDERKNGAKMKGNGRKITKWFDICDMKYNILLLLRHFYYINTKWVFELSRIFISRTRWLDHSFFFFFYFLLFILYTRILYGINCEWFYYENGWIYWNKLLFV